MPCDMHEVATQSAHAQTLLIPGLSILDCVDYRIDNHTINAIIDQSINRSSTTSDDMYRVYQAAGKLELIIWCDGHRQDAYNKRPTAETNEPVTRKKARTACNDLNSKTLDEVDAPF